MIDYTKYKLKSPQEVLRLLETVPRLWIVWCKKCYKEFQPEHEEVCHPLLEGAGPAAEKIAGCIGLDFLCNNHHTAKQLEAQGAGKFDAVGVISCGLGIQFVAGRLEGKTVLALADSIPQSGNATSVVAWPGIALEPEKCAACAQCYLNTTGGICPVVACAKSLLNGPCGGAKNGKCEVNPDMPCAWDEIYRRLAARKETFAVPVQYRNYQKFPYKDKKTLSAESTERREAGFFGGIYPLERKEETEHRAIEQFPDPESVTLFLSQHTGAPARAVVKAGDRVSVGQMVAESAGLISTALHAPIGGTVTGIGEWHHPALGRPMPAVVIEGDGRGDLHSSVQPLKDWETLSADRLAAFIQEKGIVGLGGAMFPTHVKLKPPKPVDTLIIYGCECEPLVSADNRMMIEYGEEIMKGVEVARKTLGVNTVIFGIEENKPAALESVVRHAATFPAVKVVPLKTKYPQGAEKVLITRLTGRKVPEGGLPLDVGVVVLNVSTAYAIFEAVFKGLPLIRRVVSVGGEGVIKPGNYLIKIGTLLADVIAECCGGSVPDDVLIKMGGPMMGIVQEVFGAWVIKGTNGYSFLKKTPVSSSEERKCIKCGRCVEVCPVELLPLYYAEYGRRGDWAECGKHGLKNCIECGCCEYICSSKIALVPLIKRAKKCLSQK